MKHWLYYSLLLVAIGTTYSARAAGLIVVDDARWGKPGPPEIVPPPWPPPHPRPLPSPRVYDFAPIELSSHQVNVRIKDQVATTSIDQESYNPNSQRMEGTFLFPVPKGAHLDKFSIDIDGRPVEAELLLADKARKLYEDIVRKMKDPALLEYAGRDLFKVRIFPFEPLGRKRVKLSYSQVLKADSGLISYNYPLGTEKFSARPVKNVSLKIELESSRALKSIYSPSHVVEIRRSGAHRATIGYEAAQTRADSDFQLFFTQDEDDVGMNLMTYKIAGEDGYFLLLASPGVDVKNQKVILKDVTFVLDTSGSMAGKKLAQAKKALQFCVENLNDGDRFEIIRFATETESLFDKLVDASAENRSRANQFIGALKPIGGTAIDAALLKALTLHPGTEDRPFVVIFLTDGLPTVGNTDENQIVASVTKASQSNIHVFCFGIGTDVNTHLLDRIAESTKSFSQYVLPEEDIELKVSNFFTKIKEPVLSNVSIIFPQGMRATGIYPSPLSDLFKGEQLLVVGRYTGRNDGQLVIKGTVNGVVTTFRYDVNSSDQAGEHDFIPRLWATRRVGYLLDEIRLHGENKEVSEEATELARKYGIVTPYTAFLILEDEKQRNVPITAQSLPQLGREPLVRQRMDDAWHSFQEQKVGKEAIAGARYGLALKSASSAADAISSGNEEAQRGLYPAAPLAVRGGGLNSPASSNAKAPGEVQYDQQSRFVGGRNFYQNGNQWLDANVQKFASAKRHRIQFNSTEYFDLVAKEPDVRPWLALGQNVQFVLDSTVYEIYE
ncbi:MAG: VIT domain-containing protein [Verrucomicrobiota bacterium]